MSYCFYYVAAAIREIRTAAGRLGGELADAGTTMEIPVEESGIPGMTVAAGGSGIPGTTVAAEESGIPEMTVAAGIQGMIPVWKGVLALSHRLAALAGVRKKSKPYGKKGRASCGAGRFGLLWQPY